MAPQKPRDGHRGDPGFTLEHLHQRILHREPDDAAAFVAQDLSNRFEHRAFACAGNALNRNNPVVRAQQQPSSGFLAPVQSHAVFELSKGLKARTSHRWRYYRRCLTAPLLDRRDNALLARNCTRCGYHPAFGAAAALELALALELRHAPLDCRHGSRQTKAQCGFVDLGARKCCFALGQMPDRRGHSMDRRKLLGVPAGEIARYQGIASPEPKLLSKLARNILRAPSNGSRELPQARYLAEVSGSARVGARDNRCRVKPKRLGPGAPCTRKRAAILDHPLVTPRHKIGGVARGKPP